jgi:uncharacterized protein YggE
MKRMILFALFALSPVAARAQQSDMRPAPPPQLSVSAQGSSKSEPDQAVLNIAVETQASSARAAAQGNATKMDALVASMKALGITGPNIRTTSYNLTPEYSYPKPGEETPPRITGYRAINAVQIVVDTVARAGRIIDAAVATGANRLEGISFQLRNPEAARLEALRDAVRMARAQADAITQALGVRLGPVMNVSANYQIIRPPYPMAPQMLMKVASDQAQTPVEAGEIETQATVNITYRLEN